MALVTRKEFAAMCGKSVQTINTYIVRKKLFHLKSDKSLMDTQFLANKQFLDKAIAERNGEIVVKIKKEKPQEPKRPPGRPKKTDETPKKIKQSPPATKTKIPIEDVDPETDDGYREPDPKKQQKKRTLDEDDEESMISVFEAEAKKKIADAEKAVWQAEKERLAVEKLTGKLMPVDLVEQILRVNIHHIFKSFENELSTLASIYCDILAAGDRGKLAELIGKMRVELARIIKDTSTTAKAEIENVVADYSEVRSRGERK